MSKEVVIKAKNIRENPDRAIEVLYFNGETYINLYTFLNIYAPKCALQTNASFKMVLKKASLLATNLGFEQDSLYLKFPAEMLDKSPYREIKKSFINAQLAQRLLYLFNKGYQWKIKSEREIADLVIENDRDESKIIFRANESYIKFSNEKPVFWSLRRGRKKKSRFAHKPS